MSHISTISKSEHNKITPTADLISYFRVFSDTPYVKEIAEMTNAEKTARNILKEHFDTSSFLAVMSEARYKKIDLYAKEFTNILEVAIGRSPRDLILTENPKLAYVATDLQDSIKNHEKIISEIIEKHDLNRSNLHFAAVNALNLEELKSAEEILPKGELLIISEGMMVYFSLDEKRKFLENVHKILEKRGGALITSDFISISSQGKESFKKGFEGITKATSRDMRSSNFGSLEEINKFIDECDFDSYNFNPSINLVSIKRLNLENNPQAQRVANLPVLVLKVKKH
jgi:hypothetical protein